MTDGVRLRRVVESDIATFYGFQSEPGACEMAAYTPKGETEFRDHWLANIENENLRLYTILYDERVAGNIVTWESESGWEVGYWLGSAYQGQGVTSTALALLLENHTTRPLYAVVASHNKASIRVLNKNGFVACGTTFLDFYEEKLPAIRLLLR